MTCQCVCSGWCSGYCVCKQEQCSDGVTSAASLSSVRVYQQLLRVKLQHRPELLDSLYFSNLKVGVSLCCIC